MGPLGGRQLSSVPIVYCGLIGEPRTTTLGLTHWPMHPATARLSVRRLTLRRSNEQKKNCTKASSISQKGSVSVIRVAGRSAQLDSSIGLLSYFGSMVWIRVAS